MRANIDVDGIDSYRVFLAGFSDSVDSATDDCLRKASAACERWNDIHAQQTVEILLQLKKVMSSFSNSCESYCRTLKQISDKYRAYLSGRIS